jgi:hypothetical protein
VAQGGINIGGRTRRGRITSGMVTAFGALTIAVGAFAGGGSATAAPPVTGEGNPTCASLQIGGSDVKNDPPSNTTIDGITFSYSDDGKTVTVTADAGITILAVIIKAGDAFTLLTEPPFTGSAPLTNGDQLPEISHVSVCYSVTPPTTAPPTTAPPTTAPPTTAPPTTAPPTTAPPTTAAPTTAAPTTAAPTTTAVASQAPVTTVAAPTTTAVSPASATLPATGRGNRGLLVAGTVLVLAGFGLRRLGRPTS